MMEYLIFVVMVIAAFVIAVWWMLYVRWLLIHRSDLRSRKYVVFSIAVLLLTASVANVLVIWDIVRNA